MSELIRVRVAFVGKGGSGKSTIAGTFARLLGRAGRPVLAIDSDPLPGLPYSLGVAVDDRPIPDDTVTEGPPGGPRWVLAPHMDPDTLVERHGRACPDGVRYLQFGNLRGHVAALQKAQHAWSQVVSELDPHRWDLVGDLPGGTRQPFFGWAKYAEVVCVVAEPTAKSLHTARRLLNLSKAKWAPRSLAVVASKVRGPGDAERIADRLGAEVLASVPHSDPVLAADRRGAAPLDADPQGDFARAVGVLVERVLSLYPAAAKESA